MGFFNKISNCLLFYLYANLELIVSYLQAPSPFKLN